MLDREKWLNLVVDALPEQQRSIINAIYFEGLSERECEKRFAISDSTIRRIRDEALASLRGYYDALNEEFPDE